MSIIEAVPSAGPATWPVPPTRTSPVAAVYSGVGAAGPEAVAPPPGGSTATAPTVDHALVDEVRREVSDALAIRLREAPVSDPRARRELARALLTGVLVERARDRVHAGARPWSVDEEFAIADSVMAAIFCGIPCECRGSLRGRFQERRGSHPDTRLIGDTSDPIRHSVDLKATLPARTRSRLG